MAKILAIDDNKDILNLIKRSLEKAGHQVTTVENTKLATKEKLLFADLILLDVMLPDEDGFRFCERVRRQVTCPIIFVTAKTAENDMIQGLGIGGDDYIQKPFSIRGLRAKVDAHLRRDQRRYTELVHLDNYAVNLLTRECFYQDNLIPFTKSEYNLVAFLITHPKQIFSKEQLHENVFGYEHDTTEKVIVEHIKNVRAKCRLFDSDPIKTVWGIGYQWQ
ncbi:response regulator transcription factor [Vagococcus vulneris]|uniref:DNA-binding response regulator n=1 Tax=Vagococcus vulneris TaxID=1977869 RepID=A0A429ZZC5_9ENTE|nr:response regulator transcription factor [Vagococcus vulneris]RST99369.1 DNA-binding response regulator [Vagococcus vulneris]